MDNLNTYNYTYGDGIFTVYDKGEIPIKDLFYKSSNELEKLKTRYKLCVETVNN